MKKVQQGFTLIELMIVVAIIGILAAIAIPAYQDYTIRAKVSEPMTFLDAAKVSIAEYYQARGVMPPDMSAAGIVDSSSQYIASIAFTTGNPATITVTTHANNLGGTANGKTLTLKGLGAANGTVSWDCKGGTLDAKYRPASCR
ncbi:MAG TPA: pilin [Gammaproteobacteria bacterium]|nr:pilin [Gammaproteobacteria bacterium]